MKIVHCSDLHLGKRNSGKKIFVEKRYNDLFIAFEKLISKILNLEVDVMIISGDIFDKKEINPDVLAKTENLFLKLKEKNIKIIAIEGNHDTINQNENSWLDYLKNKKYLDVFSFKYDFNNKKFIKIEDVNIFPVGYPGYMVDSVMENLAKDLPENEKNIVIVHTSFFDSDNFPGLIKTETIDLFKDKAIYIAGGHTHSFKCYPKENPYFFVPGSLEYINYPNESSNKKGFIYFDTDTLKYDFIEIENRKRIKLGKYQFEKYDEEEILKFRNFIKNFELSGEEVVLVDIEISGKDYINIIELEEIIESEGALKAYVKIKIKNTDSNGIIFEESLSIEEIETKIMENWDIFEDNKNFIKNFSKLKNLYLDGKNEEFIEQFDKILGEDVNDN